MNDMAGRSNLKANSIGTNAITDKPLNIYETIKKQLPCTLLVRSRDSSKDIVYAIYTAQQYPAELVEIIAAIPYTSD